MSVDIESLVITNAASTVKTLADAEALLPSAVTRITIGSVRYDFSPGNSGETYYYDPETKTALNSMGLPSQGLNELMSWLPGFHERAKEAGKEVAVSIAGVSSAEYGMLASKVWPFCDIIEVNAGCGNVWGTSGQKPIPSYEPALLQEIIRAVGDAIKQRGMISVKVSPVPDELIDDLARVVGGYRMIVEVIACNTLPLREGTRPDGGPALAFLAPGTSEVNHKGGLSGRPLKAHSLRVLTGMRQRAPHLRYIGCGGIFDADDAREYLALGVGGIAIGTAWHQSSPRIFGDIFAGL